MVPVGLDQTEILTHAHAQQMEHTNAILHHRLSGQSVAICQEITVEQQRFVTRAYHLIIILTRQWRAVSLTDHP